MQPYVKTTYNSSLVTDHYVIPINAISYLDVIKALMKSGRLKWNTDYNLQRVEGKGRAMVILAFVTCQLD